MREKIKEEYTHHYWGDETFDWREFDEAITYIHVQLTRVGFGVSSKEKWGNADIYAYAWGGHIFDLLPYNFRRKYFPKALRTLDFKFGDLLSFLKILPLINKVQYMFYRRVYRRAFKKWPQFKYELIGGMCQWEELKDLLIEHHMTAPYKSEECHEGKHIYVKGYCKECYASESNALKPGTVICHNFLSDE